MLQPGQLLLARSLCLADGVLEPLDLCSEPVAFLDGGVEGGEALERCSKLLMQPLALVREVAALVGMAALLFREGNL